MSAVEKAAVAEVVEETVEGERAVARAAVAMAAAKEALVVGRATADRHRPCTSAS